MGELVIERATAEDASDVLALMAAQFSEHEIGLEGTQLGEAIRRMVAEEGLGFILVAREAGRLVGATAVAYNWTLEHGGKSAWLDELYVLPERRNAGVGTALLERVMAEAVREGCLAMDLEVDAEHQRAEKLYERFGFHRLERRRWARRLD